jgi:hypothetical protein
MTSGTTVSPRRVDWKTERERIDLAEVATRLLGPAPGRRGGGRSRLWWLCPFHDDRNPSFCVSPGKTWWRCRSCGAHGDAATLVMKKLGKTFPEAVAYLTGGFPARSATCQNAQKAARSPQSPPTSPSGLSAERAIVLVEESAARLWEPDGQSALKDLTGRGLAHETIRRARLGMTPPLEIPKKEGTTFSARGIVIPWFGKSGRLALVMIRQPPGVGPKYLEVFRDPAALCGIYPGPEVILPGRPLVLVEGQFDALVLGQELDGLASVATLGSASNRPSPSLWLHMLGAAPWYVATDADDAGDKAATSWPAHTRRVRPPVPFKDWSDARAGGVNLRHSWQDTFARESFLIRLQTQGIRLDGDLVHPRIVVGTLTGRVTYTDPALQSSVKKTERLTRLNPAVEGRRFARADYGQIEPRILHSILTVKGLIDWYPGHDLYLTLAVGAIDRDMAKIIVNKLINGGRPPSNATGRLAEFIRAADIYRADLAAQAKVDGFVRTLAGRAILLAPDEENHSGKAVNRVVQGTAADIFNMAAIRIDDAIRTEGLPASVAFLLYDEIWVEAEAYVLPQIIDLIRSEMEAAALAFGVTIPVKFGSDAPASQEDQAASPEPGEDFEERAAILEFDGGLTRIEAEEKARRLLAENRSNG